MSLAPKRGKNRTTLGLKIDQLTRWKGKKKTQRETFEGEGLWQERQEQIVLIVRKCKCSERGGGRGARIYFNIQKKGGQARMGRKISIEGKGV